MSLCSGQIVFDPSLKTFREVGAISGPWSVHCFDADMRPIVAQATMPKMSLNQIPIVDFFLSNGNRIYATVEQEVYCTDGEWRPFSDFMTKTDLRIKAIDHHDDVWVKATEHLRRDFGYYFSVPGYGNFLHAGICLRDE